MNAASRIGSQQAKNIVIHFNSATEEEPEIIAKDTNATETQIKKPFSEEKSTPISFISSRSIFSPSTKQKSIPQDSVQSFDIDNAKERRSPTK